MEGMGTTVGAAAGMNAKTSAWGFVRPWPGEHMTVLQNPCLSSPFVALVMFEMECSVSDSSAWIDRLSSIQVAPSPVPSDPGAGDAGYSDIVSPGSARSESGKWIGAKRDGWV
jgi:hypothetical protein